jgi:signal peptidase I
MEKTWRQNLWEIVKFIAITLLIVIPFRMFIAQPFIVSGASMVPTFHNSEYLIVDELSYYLRSPARGEVIIFKYPKNPKVYYIKRIVGLPGETVTIRNNQVFVQSPGSTEEAVTWTNVDNETKPIENAEPVTLGSNEYFVMGDNRTESSDSRYWGALPRNLITGRAFIRLFPFGKVGINPGGI